MTFPPGFVFGAATSAYQIEGGRTDDAGKPIKGQSIWDTFSDNGRMADPGDVTCDHYHRYPEDVALMRQLGLDAYRLSIAWTRVLPDGDGDIDRLGIEFYNRLIDKLLEAGVDPWVTLFHWDLPQALQDRGGWAHRGTVDAFSRYTEVVVGALGDRVQNWITHNEPWVAATLGYIEGVFAPGLTDWAAGLAAGHHILLSHGRAASIIRELAKGSSVGIALDCRPSRPASDDPADVAASSHFDGFRNRWYFDPVFGRGYPDDIASTYRARGRWSGVVVKGDDLDVIAAPLDFLGINYYTSISVEAGAEETEKGEVPAGPDAPPGFTEMGWEITPSALTDFLTRVRQDYGPRRIVITQTGASYSDAPGLDGEVHDLRRIAYLHQHLTAVAHAIDAGVPVGGFFVWSLLDNLEWVSGFSQRFGLVYVDHKTGERTPKDSFYWYRRAIKRRGLNA